jgi:hypothetical protein
MPKALLADWNLAQALYVQGVPYADIAEKIGVTSATLRQHAHRHHWRRYVEEPVGAGWTESPWERVEAQVVLGGAEFVARVRARLGAGDDPREQPSLQVLRQRPCWEQVVRAVEEVKQERWAAFRDRHADWGRDMALYVARRCCGTGLKALGGGGRGIGLQERGGGPPAVQEEAGNGPVLARLLRADQSTIV